ncbi:MAG TPA: site-2 protease family protein [Thermoanaerobaculia bacterium]|jgi:regulator of sigma E protease
MSYLAVFGVLSLLIVVHEAGHLLAAKLVGLPIESFSVGLGPKLWARRWGRVEYVLRAFPLGGFVVPAIEESEIRIVPLGRRLVFFLGGPLANLAVTLPLFALSNVLRYGFSLFALLVAPFQQAAAGCRQMLALVAEAFARPESLSGVVGIVVEGGKAAQSGMILELTLSLTLSLALLNLLPIPMLDGGQIVMGCLEELFPRLVRLRVPLTVAGMVLLAALMIYLNLRDVLHLIA